MREKITNEAMNEVQDVNTSIESPEKADSKETRKFKKSKERVKKEKIKKERTPQQKKRNRRIVVFSILGAAVLLIVCMGAKAANTLPTLQIGALKMGEVIERIDSSGAIKSLDQKVYFSPIDGTVADVKVSLGDAVKAGDVLVTFDDARIDKDIQNASLKKDAAEGSYSNSLQTNGRTCSNLNEALAALPDLQAKIEYAKGVVKFLEDKIADKKASLSYEGSQLQISLLDYYPGDEEYSNLQKLIQDNNYQQGNNAEIREWESQLKAANDILSELKSDEATMKSKKESAKDATMTKGARQELEANHESTLRELDEQIDKLNLAKEGIKADYNGVITELDAISGADVIKSGQMLTLESLENVVVGIELTKFDMEKVRIDQEAVVSLNGVDYEAKVSHIDKMAQVNRTGATVVGAQVKLKNPDDNLVLGLDAKVKIIVGKNENALLVPNEQILYDQDGAFVYICPEGKLEKRHITLGLADDENTEVLEGLSKDDMIVLNPPENMEEGTLVKTIEQ